MKIAVYGRLLKSHNIPYIQQFFDLLSQKNITHVIYDGFYANIKKEIQFKKDPATFKENSDICNDVDFLFSLGGDGTLLDTVTLIRDSNIPIIGINIGRLGFLAGLGKEEIEAAIEALEKGTFIIDKRTLIQLDSVQPLFGNVNYALNEMTIHKTDSSFMMKINAYLNGEFLNSYWSDGLIVSTPTGSTGYSLSCGGPVVSPKSKNFIITPIAPHNMNIRPIVIPDDIEISFKIEDPNINSLCTLDSRSATIDASNQLSVKKAPFTISLVRLDDHYFISTLRNKLMWGADKRN